MQHTCIDSEANALMYDNSMKPIKFLEIGDRVKTLNSQGQLDITDVIMVMDVNDQECNKTLPQLNLTIR